MLRFFLIFLIFPTGILFAQDLSISGKIVDSEGEGVSFVNILLFSEESETPITGTSTNTTGEFELSKVEVGLYKIRINHIGYQRIERTIELNSNKVFEKIILVKSTETLDEARINTKKPTLKIVSGNLIFNVENTSFSVGNTMDLLKKTPGVLVFGDKIQVKSSTPVIYFNGKRVYLSSAEILRLLQNTDAANIKSIEVITEASSKYDADAESVINIITSKAISIGYKGSINTSYILGVYPKYNLGTIHFYKNNWINVSAAYSYSDGKYFKEDNSHIRFFNPDGETTKSVWDTYFDRTTRTSTHSGRANIDFNLDDKNTLSFNTNLLITPKMTYENTAGGEIRNSLGQIDSLYSSVGHVERNADRLTFNVDYKREFDDIGSTLTLASNYIYYKNKQFQNLQSDYFSNNGTALGINNFSTDSYQESDIFTGQGDFTTALWDGTLETGLKLSSTKTHSKLDFFNIFGSDPIFNTSLSDDFDYKEWIFAGYFNYQKSWEKWSLTLGLRAEQTDITSLSKDLDEDNDQSYFDIFPSAVFHRKLDEQNGIGISYKRSLRRPNYESLNPFRYYITDNNFTGGNPDLKPSIKDRISLNFDHKNKLFFSLYYENTDNYLDLLYFQDNENQSLRTLSENLIKAYQYSFDVQYYSNLTDWWWFYLSTSSFYFANEFYALESLEEKYTNDVFGQYIQSISNFKISKDGSWSSDLTMMYLSKFVTGSQYFNNQSFVNLSVRKSLWDNRASISVGVNDIFNTSDVRVFSKYYNQDNNYLANSESRNVTVNFKYDFGNASLRDNQREINTDETKRLKN